MSMAFKSQGQLSQIVSGLQVPDSAYGQAMPYVFGHCRIPHKLIYWADFQSQQQGGKKGGKGGGTTVYTVNADMALAYGPLEGLASVWQNQTWFYVNYSSQTFTGSGTATSFTFTISNNTSTFVMVMGVAYQHSFSQAFADYAGFGISRSFTIAGTEFAPLYNNNFTAPNNGFWQNAGIPYAAYNATYGDDTITVTFPTAVTNPVVIVYYCEVGGSDQPPAAGTSKKGGGGIPIQQPGLVFERELGAGPSGQPINYPEFSGVAGAGIPLGPSPELPYFNYEVKALFGLGNAAPVASFDPSSGGYAQGTTSGDCNLADVILDFITSGNLYSLGATGVTFWNHGVGFTAFAPPDPTPFAYAAQYFYSRYGGILKDESNLWGSAIAGNGSNQGLNALREYCLAYGIFISGSTDSQQEIAQFLGELCKVGNCAPVYDGAGLDFIPYCEVSNYANGAAYTAPTSAGPIADLTDQNFLPVEGKAPVQASTDRPSENYNTLNIGYKDATQQFNDNFVIVSDAMDIVRQGSMPGPQETYSYITSPKVAQSVGIARLRRNLAVGGLSYSFSLPAMWEVIFTPMDLITAFEPTLSAQPIPMRLTHIRITVAEEGKRKMECTAEPFFYGASVPTPSNAVGGAVQNASTTNGAGSPGSVNAPIIFEAIPAISPNGPALWFCTSGPAAAYGGCAIYLSTDGGATYGTTPIGTIQGRQTMGAVYSANYPSHANPDSTNTLNVDFTESLGDLTGVSSAAQAALQSLWYLAGGGTVVVNGQTLTIPYELGAFQGATLSAANKYALSPPNLRGVYGTPIAAHNIGSAFSYLNDGLIFKWPLPLSLIGTTLFFKFVAFNNTGGNAQSLSDVSAYTFTPSGLVGFSSSTSGGGPGGVPVTVPVPTGSTVAPANDFYINVPLAAGTYTASQELFYSEPARNITIPSGLTGTNAGCRVAPTGAVTVTLLKNGSSVGTMNFAASSTAPTFTFTSAVSFNGTTDSFSIQAPATGDPTFAGFFCDIWASRSN